MKRVLAVCLALVCGSVAFAQQSPDFPRGSSFIIQLTSSQFVSGFGDYLVPPLLRAFRKTGMRYNGRANVDYAATVQTDSDVGKWVAAEDGSSVWIYRRSVTVGLSPADVNIEPKGVLRPWFAVKVVLDTPDQDRVDELNCLIALATAELAYRYKLKGLVKVNGSSCLRK
ncbi:MAG: hypothetical protein QNJ09_10145 [Paracoccaceae bacterium]|nr:hypothetical protein [Paracoccaceae bacterium]